MELNKEVLDCMKALRRRLREELALDIRLSQADVIDAMLEGCLQSDDEDTRSLGQRLAQLTDTPQRPVTTAPATVELPARAPSTSVRIYRGQRVYA